MANIKYEKSKTKGDFLFIGSDNKPHYEKDYTDYFLNNNIFTKSHIEQIRKGNPKVLGRISHKIWLKSLDDKNNKITYKD
jgi:hypothetical protein